MPKLSEHSSGSLRKLLFIGDCLPGGVEVSVKRGAKARKMSIRELYNRHEGNHHNRQNIPTQILSDFGGYAASNNLLAVVASGEKNLLMIETSTKKLRTSYNHKFLTSAGWAEARDLENGMYVACWRSARSEGIKLSRKNTKRNWIYSIPYHPFGAAHWIDGRNYKRKALAYIVIEAFLNKLSVDDFIKILRKEPSLANELRYLPEDTVIHHLNGDELDDSYDNLQILTDKEHNTLHYKELIQKSKSIIYEPILSVEKAGSALTFDLCMEAPYNNFIANGLVVHNSGTGKTTALAPLVERFKLRIFDFDNLLDPLLVRIRRDYPDKIDNIEFMSFRDKLKPTEMGPIIDGMPTAFIDALKAMVKWEDGSKPSDWGPDTIAVIDSHTTQARAAYFWARGIAGISGLPEGMAAKGVDGRSVFFTAQQAVMNCIASLTAPQFNANLIVIAHIKYMEHDGQTKGFPLSVGTAISPEIPSYFPTVVLATKNSSGRVLRTRSTNMIDLKDPRAFDPAFATELPMDKGLLELFK